jgi:hypothetical protein
MLSPKKPNEMPSAMVGSIAFAIKIVPQSTQNHVGLIYRSHNSKIMLLHLAWHYDLRHQEWDGTYYWLELSGLETELQETFADWAVLVADATPGTPIPYSVIFRVDRNFDQGGQFINLNDGSGLTCATFLLALFNDFNLPLIDISTWPKARKGDFVWLRRILRFLRHTVLKDQKMPAWVWLEQFKQRHQLKRFRPEEVFATAGLFAGEPLKFTEVEIAGHNINAALKE